MKTIYTEIRISASTEKIWKVLMDHSKYNTWNPFIKSIIGDPKKGNQIEVNLQLENDKPMKFKPIVLENKTAEEFRWKGQMFVKGLFDGEHFFQLKKVSENESIFIHGENFSGLLSSALFSLIGTKTKVGFEKMNESLKKIVEY